MRRASTFPPAVFFGRSRNAPRHRCGAVAILLGLAGCAGDGAPTAVEPVVDAPMSRETTTTTTTTTVSSTMVEPPAVPELPPVDDEVATATLLDLENSDLIPWVEEANRAVDSNDPPCDPDGVMLRVDDFAIAADLADEVTAELILNLDASLGAAAEWCRRSDEADAAVELDDARYIATVLRLRAASPSGSPVPTPADFPSATSVRSTPIRKAMTRPVPPSPTLSDRHDGRRSGRDDPSRSIRHTPCATNHCRVGRGRTPPARALRIAGTLRPARAPRNVAGEEFAMSASSRRPRLGKLDQTIVSTAGPSCAQPIVR